MLERPTSFIFKYLLLICIYRSCAISARDFRQRRAQTTCHERIHHPSKNVNKGTEDYNIHWEVLRQEQDWDQGALASGGLGKYLMQLIPRQRATVEWEPFRLRYHRQKWRQCTQVEHKLNTMTQNPWEAWHLETPAMMPLFGGADSSGAGWRLEEWRR